MLCDVFLLHFIDLFFCGLSEIWTYTYNIGNIILVYKNVIYKYKNGREPHLPSSVHLRQFGYFYIKIIHSSQLTAHSSQDLILIFKYWYTMERG